MQAGRSFTAFFLLAIITSPAVGQVIPANRITYFTMAGYPGKIPVYLLVKNITNFGGNGNGTSTNYFAL